MLACAAESEFNYEGGGIRVCIRDEARGTLMKKMRPSDLGGLLRLNGSKRMRYARSVYTSFDRSFGCRTHQPTRCNGFKARKNEQ